MNITGITAEYNPLHNGHVYHIEETRRQSGCDALIVAMSGDFVQRGEPAILDKWLRAEHALRAGADLVVEIPTLYSLGNASQYASASVRILESLGCGVISFGSGSGNIKIISDVAGILAENRDLIDSHISAMIKEGKSYPAARAETYRSLRERTTDHELLEKEIAVLSEPNDILALEYIANMQSSRPLVIKRQGAYHESTERNEADYRSAESIRTVIAGGGYGSDELSNSVPEFVVDTLGDCKPIFPDDCFDILKYSILSTDADTIDDCPSGGEGLGNLLKSTVNEADSFSDLVLRVKSKRYTYTRISRLCMQTMLGITRQKYDLSGPEYIRVLGHSEKGREVLAELRNAVKGADEDRSLLPVITNINKESGKLDESGLAQLALDIYAGDIYALISGIRTPERAEQRMRPVMV